MNIRINVLGIVFVGIAALSIQAQTRSPDVQFQEAKKLFDFNCNECENRDAQGHQVSFAERKISLERAIALLNAAIKGGYRNPTEAYTLIGEIYNNLAFGYGETPAERRQILLKMVSAYEQAALHAPRDISAWLRFGGILDEKPGVTDEELEKVYRKALSIDPESGPALLGIGWALIRQNKVEEGTPLFMRSLKHLSLEDKVNFAPLVADELEKHGRHEEAIEFRRQGEAAKKEYEKESRQ